MPSKFRARFARDAGPSRTRFDPARARRRQQCALYGGGAAFTVFVVMCAMLVVRLELLDHFAQMRNTFLRHEARVDAELATTRKLLTRNADRLQRQWQLDERASDDVLQEFVDGHGRFARKRFGRDALVGMADIDGERSAHAHARYLALMLRQFEAASTQPAHDTAWSGYLIALDGTFVGVFSPALAARALALPIGFPTKLLVRHAMPSDGGRPTQSAASGADAVLIERHVDPLLGRAVLRLAQRLYDADGRPFAWLVVNATADMERIAASRRNDPAFALLDRNANLLAGSRPARETVELASDAARTAQSDRDAVRRIGSRFVVSDRLPDFDLILTMTFSSRSVAVALALPAGLTAGAALLAIAAIWAAIVRFDRRVLRPANRHAARMIERAALNRALMRTVPAGVMLVSAADGAALVRNEAMRAYERAASDPPLGKRVWDTYRGRAADPDARGAIAFELTLDGAPGQPIRAAVTVTRSRYRGVDALLCTLIDITHRKHDEQQLRDAHRAPDDADNAKLTFLATISHEMRTPLNAIVGNLELMANAPLPPAEQRRVGTIMSAAHTLLRSINDVLDLSKAVSGQLVLERMPFDLRALLRDVTATFEPAAHAKRIALECRLSSELADGYVGDSARVRQLVWHLISNAIRFTDRGSVTIDAEAIPGDGSAPAIEIRVRDTGVGIPEDRLPTLFDVHRDAAASIDGRSRGAGIGLPLCRRIVELMHGELSVDSRAGAGSTLTAVLPLPAAPADWRGCAAGAADAIAAPADARMHSSDIGAAPLRVLVAEDHPASRALLQDQFDALNHDATIVANGVEAMRAYFSAPFDVVLTDLGMPELDGFAFANFLREQRSPVPVIAMTAHATEDDYRRCERVGVAEVVLKPLSIDALDAALRRHAGRAPQAVSRDAGAAERPAVTAEIRDRLTAATRRSLASIGGALSAGDADRVKVELHSMRGGFALAGDDAACDACARAERTLAERGIDALAPAWPALCESVDAALERLSDRETPDAGRRA
ncbi:response regulator [Burkholderia dolosa]|nr:ATP-binding protein [Burkholderia dolosa]MBR8460254.1 response regulator [Burkholderia dolosa]